MARPKNTPMQEVLKKEISDTLNRLLDARGLNQAEFAEKAGIPKTTMNGYIKGTSLPTPGNVEKMARLLNVTKSDIDPRFRTDILNKSSNLIELSPATVKIPILGTIACGDPIYAEENFIGYRYESPDRLPSGNLIYLEAKGDSMEPTIPNGSFVLIREQPEIEYGEIAAVRINGNTEATLKRVKKQGNTILLMPDNPKHDPIVVDENNPITIIGKAVKFTVDL